MDRNKLIGLIVEKTGIKLDPDDPAFVLVELNRITLEEAAENVALNLREAASKFEITANHSHEAHKLIANDLQKFGELVTSFENVTLAAIAEMKSIKAPSSTPVLLTQQKPSITSKQLLFSLFSACILSSMLSACFVLLFNSKTAENARLGQAVTNALPYIDADTKKKLETAIQKASAQ